MSISLPASLFTSLVIGGATIESDVNAAVTNLDVDYLANTVSFTVRQGTTSAPNFSPGQYPPSYQFVVNLSTGVWTVNGSALTGTISGVVLANINTTFKNLRNTTENFAVNQNLFPGATQVAW